MSPLERLFLAALLTRALRVQGQTERAATQRAHLAGLSCPRCGRALTDPAALPFAIEGPAPRGARWWCSPGCYSGATSALGA